VGDVAVESFSEGNLGKLKLALAGLVKTGVRAFKKSV
jgi:hypothetical protein